ncbi:hypothetical protein ACU4GH_24120 [Bradyrhizobium betae]
MTEVLLPPFHLNGVELLACSQDSDRLVEDIALDERLQGAHLRGHSPLEIADGTEIRRRSAPEVR